MRIENFFYNFIIVNILTFNNNLTIKFYKSNKEKSLLSLYIFYQCIVNKIMDILVTHQYYYLTN